jgi:hypothetical protein
VTPQEIRTLLLEFFDAHYESLYVLARAHMEPDRAEKRCVAAFHKITTLISENLETPRLSHDSLLRLARRFILAPHRQCEPARRKRSNRAWGQAAKGNL